MLSGECSGVANELSIELFELSSWVACGTLHACLFVILNFKRSISCISALRFWSSLYGSARLACGVAIGDEV